MMSTPCGGADQRLAVERVAGDSGGALEFRRHLAAAGNGADFVAGVDEGLGDDAAEPAIGAEDCDLGHFSSPCLRWRLNLAPLQTRMEID